MAVVYICIVVVYIIFGCWDLKVLCVLLCAFVVVVVVVVSCC